MIHYRSKEEIEKAIPLGTRVRYKDSDQEGEVCGYRTYSCANDPRNNTYCIGYSYVIKGCRYVDHAWPEDLIIMKLLSDLEHEIKAYIDEEMKQLVG